MAQADSAQSGPRVKESGSQSEVWMIYVCECGYLSMSAGRCRSHPYPFRAVGPEMRRVQVVPIAVRVERDKLRADLDQIEELDAENARLLEELRDGEA